MLLKSSVPVLLSLACCLISGNLASPYLGQSNGDGLLPNDVEESVKQLTSEIEESVSQMFYNNLVTIGNTRGFEIVGRWSFRLMIRFEFLAMADGSHFLFPLNGKADLEREHKTVALAVSKLLMNLKTMERTDQVLKNVSKITEDTKITGENKENLFKAILHAYFQILDDSMEADEELRHIYKQRKSEAEDAVRQDPKMLEPLYNDWDPSARFRTIEEFMTFANNAKIIRQGIANKLFMNQAVKHFSMIFSQSDHQRYLLARALIQIAHSSSSESKINEIYQQALVRAGELPFAVPWFLRSDMLFNTIEKALESEPMLKTEVQTMMKQIEGSTIYDTDMFHIDFSLL